MSPASFWFRAQPGGTAAFRTQTIFGHYRLRSIAFNYEIAPGDFTFQVSLYTCGPSGIEERGRFDDGAYVLGRQKFATNRKTVAVNQEVEDFQIVFRKGNQLSGTAANDDWLLLGNIVLMLELAP